MSSSRDVEKAETDEENRDQLRTRHEGTQRDGENLLELDLDNMVLADSEKSGLSSRNIDHSNVKTEKPHEFHESDISEGTIKSTKTIESKESTDELQKLSDKNSSLITAIYNHKNKELISWLENWVVPNVCPISILAAACQVKCNKEALQILLDAGAEESRSGCMGVTPLHVAASTNEPKNIAKILGLPEGFSNLEPYIHRKFDRVQLWNTLKETPRGTTALHMASARANLQAVRLLLKAGANPNLRDKHNYSPLDVAGDMCSDNKKQWYLETLQLLHKNGGSFRKDNSFMVLKTALRMRSSQALTLLLDAGASFHPLKPSDYKLIKQCVKLKLQDHLEILLAYRSPEMEYRAVDLTDEEGSTVLHCAAREGWEAGVAVALFARADINVKNSAGDTALHLAAKAGNFDIVKQILDHDTNRQWNFLKQNYKGESPFSYAIFSGNVDIVEHMCYLDADMRRCFVATDIGDLTPLQYAAEKKYQKLFILILNCLFLDLTKTGTIKILTIIAKRNLSKLFYELKKKPNVYSLKYIIAEYDILHEAAKHNSREMISVLLREGADLSKKNEKGQTAISLLMCHVTKSTELMTEVLDGCINTDININEKHYEITINYSVLKPDNKYEESDDDDNNKQKTKANDMKVLEALMETGDVYDQRSLLTHPVVESFLYLKWKKCAKFIYILISAYVFFLTSLNIFIVTMYYHLDRKIKEEDIPSIINLFVWRIITGVFTSMFFCSVVIFSWFSSQPKWLCSKKFWKKMLSSMTKWRCYKTIWKKLLSYITKRTRLLLIVGGVKMIFTSMDAADTDINRGVAVITVSLSWIYLMILLSWTPTFGYFMQMYGKVSRNIIKVMLSFSFPVVSFSICFMILLRSKEPFEGPIAALMKTIVLMFEYEDIVINQTTDSPKHATNSTLDSFEDAPLTFVFMLRIFFLLFVICVSTVLTNLMLSVAVSDFQKLSHDGKQRRLMKQIECITALEKLFQQRPFSSFIWTELENWKVPSEEYVTADSKIFGKEIRESILNKAQCLKESKEKMADDIGLKGKIDDISKKQSDFEKELSEIRKSVNTILEAVAQNKDARENKNS